MILKKNTCPYIHDLLTLIKMDTVRMLLERSTCHRYEQYQL